METAAQNSIINFDHELSGTLNRAAGKGAQFALLLSMLETNVLARPHYARDVDHLPQQKLPNDYRSAPLKVSDADWQTASVQSQLFHQNPQDAGLYLTMHPQPLSLYNSTNHIDAEVITNCSYFTQQQHKQPRDPEIPVDQTGLYDILQSLHPQQM